MYRRNLAGREVANVWVALACAAEDPTDPNSNPANRLGPFPSAWNAGRFRAAARAVIVPPSPHATPSYHTIEQETET